MIFHAIDYSRLNIFPKIINDYLASNASLKPFYKYPFEFSAFSDVIADKKFPAESRQVLHDVLKEQYKNFETTPSVQNNIEKLHDPDTFTVTTAHQPVIFTGPLYFIYKIISAINLAERLRREFPEKHFVPVYYMGAEDHDFDEINHAWIFGERMEWHTEQSGAVGRLSAKNIIPLIDNVKSHVKENDAAMQLFYDAYGKHSTLAEATLFLVNKLFGEYGLIAVNPDNRRLKKLFAPIISEELVNNHSYKLAEKTNGELKHLGYEVQANPREVNLFYLSENQRERIVHNKETGNYEVLNTSLRFSEKEILNLVNKTPECFSPNVMLRPLFQEGILPNLAYIGGAGELSYWLQQKSIFEHYGINFPMLVLRNSALLVDSNTERKIKKNNLEWRTLFESEDDLTKDFISKNSSNTLGFSAEKELIAEAYKRIKKSATEIDPTLSAATDAQLANVLNALEGLEKKVFRAEKKNFETAIAQIKTIKSKLFPENSLQERVENFIPYYLQQRASFIQNLKKEFDPFRKEFLIALTDEAVAGKKDLNTLPSSNVQIQ